MKIFTFRYNLKFNPINANGFFIDLANSGIFGKVVTQAVIPGNGRDQLVTKCDVEQLRTNYITLDFLNKLEERGKLSTLV